MGLQDIAKLIAEPARDMASGRQRGFEPHQGTRHLVRPARFNDLAGCPEAQQPLGPGGRVVQDHGRHGARH